jgi:hypothetical protein
MNSESKPTPSSLNPKNQARKKELSSALKANMRRRKEQEHVKKVPKDA